MADQFYPPVATNSLTDDGAPPTRAWYRFWVNLFQIGGNGDTGTATDVLHGGGAGFGPVDLTADVSGILPVGNGGTGVQTTGQHNVFAGPLSGTAAPPSFRTLDVSDLPAGTGSVTSVDVSGGTTGLTTSGGPITSSGTITLSGTLIAANGGTGFASYAVGDILYGDTTTTLARLADVSAGSYLRSGGVTTAPLWSTLKLPNAANANFIAYATSANTWGESSGLQFNGSHVAVGGAGASPSTATQVLINDNSFTVTTSQGIQLLSELSAGGAAVSFDGIDVRPHANYAGTLPSLACYNARPNTTSASCTITNYYSFKSTITADNRMTNLYAFYSDLNSATARFAFYGAGTAQSAFGGNVALGSTTAPTVACDVTGQIAATGSISKIGGVTTSGALGAVAVVASGRVTAQNAAVASVSTFTVGASDGSFEVSANVNVTTATVHNFTVTCAYTDETNTAQTVTLGFIQLNGATFITAITNVTGVGPYESTVIHIRCKASTAITIATTGTFTTVTYNAEGIIKRTA
jgi:hypothetical protein